MKLLQFLIVLCFTISFGFPEILAAEEKATFHIPALYHVGFWVSDISKARKFYHDFLGYDEPYSLLTPQGALQMAVMKVNEDQVIYLFPNPKKILPNGDNLDHLGLIVDDAQALFNRFVESGLKVKPVHKARIGDTILTCSDPDGHIFEITQFEKTGELLKHRGKFNSTSRISDHLVSVTLRVKDLEKSLNFYAKILGFKIKQVSPGASAVIVVPDGSDTIRLVQSQENKRAVIDYRLEVLDIAKIKTRLKKSAEVLGYYAEEGTESNRPVLYLKDEDGTTVVLIEKN